MSWYILFKNVVNLDSIPNLAAVLSACCILIICNNVLLLASKVAAILSETVPKKALCSTL
ncbi:hypothetical protein [uncultured Clostridium sp.]|uniref:hypothetical protein n=1 Tax=uncultured Clostridium sp. TaxID=59620 RepID=UPI00261DE367|nr:hypothetical protein [uncultured Clostridium sp.]